MPRTDQRVLGGRYELGERIGSGGMGDVLAATRGKSGDPVAVKVIRASLLSDRSARRRFASEASFSKTYSETASSPWRWRAARVSVITRASRLPAEPSNVAPHDP